MERYKMRAESDLDVLEAIREIPELNNLTFQYPDKILTACIVTFQSQLSLETLKSKLSEIRDSHVMVDTLSSTSAYTGTR